MHRNYMALFRTFLLPSSLLQLNWFGEDSFLFKDDSKTITVENSY